MKDKFVKRLDEWESDTLSLGGRVTKIKSCLTSIRVYHFMLYRFPKTSVERMTNGTRRFCSRVANTKTNIIWLNGLWYANKKERWYVDP